jgi:hypothetical protein
MFHEFCGMESTMSHTHDQTPPDCFTLEAVEAFKSFEGYTLDSARYYIWKSLSGAGDLLYALELRFQEGESLLISSGEDSEALRITDAASLVETATRAQALNGQPVFDAYDAMHQSIWKPCADRTLLAIRLSKNHEGLYLNDALMLDFEGQKIIVGLHERGGMRVIAHEK